jgi:hypothetical protein
MSGDRRAVRSGPRLEWHKRWCRWSWLSSLAVCPGNLTRLRCLHRSCRRTVAAGASEGSSDVCRGNRPRETRKGRRTGDATLFPLRAWNCSRSHTLVGSSALGCDQLLLPRRDAQRRGGKEAGAAAGAFTRERKISGDAPGDGGVNSPIRSVNSVARKPLDEEDNPSRRLIRSPDCDESQLWAR